ncbi:hypothetical protein SDC9_209863 [bioreactor metagenome]|uniref:Uncharacterized protein n=1 Tax=bioreactor metagenome TaxID=1076179 RepID=A0A645JF61_9ZZZZ
MIAAFAQAVRHRVVLGEQRRGFTHAGNHRLEHRMRRVERRFLRHVADADAGLHPDLAVIEPALAGTGGERRQQRRLAGAVAADQGHPLAGVELEFGVIEQRHVTVGEAGVGKFQVGHGRQ